MCDNYKCDSCRECKYLETYRSNFYDDDFVDFNCNLARRTITRITSKVVRDFPVPKWCPLIFKEPKEELDDDKL